MGKKIGESHIEPDDLNKQIMQHDLFTNARLTADLYIKLISLQVLKSHSNTVHGFDIISKLSILLYFFFGQDGYPVILV